MLMDPAEMGERFKMYSLMPTSRPGSKEGDIYTPAGFAIP